MMPLAPTDDERLIEAIRYRSDFSPTHHQIGRIIAMIENGDMILVDQIAGYLRDTVSRGNDLPAGVALVDPVGDLRRRIWADYETRLPHKVIR